MGYLKDPLSKETPYDIMCIGPDTPVSQIHKKFKELQKIYYKQKEHDKLKNLNEAYDKLKNANERLKIDILYFAIPDKIQ